MCACCHHSLYLFIWTVKYIVLTLLDNVSNFVFTFAIKTGVSAWESCNFRILTILDHIIYLNYIEKSNQRETVFFRKSVTLTKNIPSLFSCEAASPFQAHFPLSLCFLCFMCLFVDVIKLIFISFSFVVLFFPLHPHYVSLKLRSQLNENYILGCF